MITIDRNQYAFGTLNASKEEWTLIKDLVRFAERNYHALDLLYSIPGPEDRRRDKLQSLVEIMDHVWGDLPIEMHKSTIFLINTCIIRADGEDVPGVDSAAQNALTDRFIELAVYDIFDDENVTDAQWKRWNAEAEEGP